MMMISAARLNGLTDIGLASETGVIANSSNKLSLARNCTWLTTATHHLRKVQTIFKLSRVQMQLLVRPVVSCHCLTLETSECDLLPENTEDIPLPKRFDIDHSETCSIQFAFGGAGWTEDPVITVDANNAFLSQGVLTLAAMKVNWYQTNHHTGSFTAATNRSKTSYFLKVIRSQAEMFA